MKTYELGESGSAFLKSLLKRGDHLAHTLQEEALSQGRLFTFLPDSEDPKKVSLIDGSRKFNSDENSWWPIELLITEHLQAPNRFFVMELDSIPREAAFRLYADKSFQFFVSAPRYHNFVDAQGKPAQEEVVGIYGYVNRIDSDMENVRDLILDRRPFGAIGVLSSLYEAELPSDGNDCEPAILAKLAANTQYILGTAYDDEGWIVWARNDLPESFKIADKIKKL